MWRRIEYVLMSLCIGLIVVMMLLSAMLKLYPEDATLCSEFGIACEERSHGETQQAD